MEDERKTKKELIEEIHELRQDVAQLKGFEEEINTARLNQEKFTKAFLQNSIPVSITTLKEGRYVDVSDAFLKYMECRRDQIIGSTAVESGFITHEQRLSYIDELNKSGRIDNFEMEFRTKNGTLKYGLFNAVMMTLGNERYLLSVMTDISMRKLVEEKLKESEEKFRILMESSPTAFLMYQNDTWIYANPAAIEITGYTGEELRGRPFADFAHPDDKKLLQTRAQMRQRGEITTKLHYEVRIIAKDGTVKWIDLSSTTIFLHGRPAGIVSFIDITERKRIDNDLKEKEDLLLIHMEESPDAVYMHYWEGTFMYCNSLCEEITGYRRDEVIGKKFTEINGLTPISQSRAMEMARESEEGKKTSIAEVDLIIKDGSIIPVELKICVIKRSGKKVVLGFLKDISKRKQAEEKDRQSHERLMTVMDSLDALVYITDIETYEILFINKYGHNIWGNVVGQKCWQSLQKGQDGPCSFCTNDRLLTAQKSSSGIYRWEWINTVTGRWFDCRDIAIQWSDGRMVRLEIATDINDRKSAEQELERYRGHLEDMVKERTDELETKNLTLQELNTTLKVLLKQRENDKNDMEERFVMNVKNLVLPYVEQMKKGCHDVGQRSYLDIIETHLHDIATPLMKKMRQFNLTPKEIKVAMLVKQGKPTKEIAVILGIAQGSVDVHRKNIREKLGLSNKKANLQSYLDNLEQ